MKEQLLIDRFSLCSLCGGAIRVPVQFQVVIRWRTQLIRHASLAKLRNDLQ